MGHTLPLIVHGAECRVRYLRQDKLHDPVHVTVLIVAADAKRIHYFLELRHTVEDWGAATSENMTLHIDMNLRRVAPYPPDVWARIKVVAEAHEKIPRLVGVGRSITMTPSEAPRERSASKNILELHRLAPNTNL